MRLTSFSVTPDGFVREERLKEQDLMNRIGDRKKGTGTIQLQASFRIYKKHNSASTDLKDYISVKIYKFSRRPSVDFDCVFVAFSSSAHRIIVGRWPLFLTISVPMYVSIP